MSTDKPLKYEVEEGFRFWDNHLLKEVGSQLRFTSRTLDPMDAPKLDGLFRQARGIRLDRTAFNFDSWEREDRWLAAVALASRLYPRPGERYALVYTHWSWTYQVYGTEETRVLLILSNADMSKLVSLEQSA